MEMGTTVLVDILMRPSNLILMTAVWALIGSLKKAAPELNNSAAFARVAPLLPIVLCIGAMWIPGVEHESMGVGERILLGCVLGFAVGHVHKLTRQTFLGKDERIGVKQT
jgi:C4-dicarboxylate transporter